MKDFAYACPATIEDAVAAMRADGARALAGGTDLIPQMREGRREVAHVVDLKRIPELVTISTRADGGLVLGAAASASSVARHADVASSYPAVARSARLIGSLQVQNRASLGGNICNAAPSADAVPALICHKASVRIAGSRSARSHSRRSSAVPARRASDRASWCRRSRLPPVAPRSAAKYLRFTPRREMDIAIAGAGRLGESRCGGRIAEARSRAGLGRTDPAPGNIGRAKAGWASDRPPPCSTPPAGSQPPTHDPSPTRAARPTTAARWSRC